MSERMIKRKYIVKMESETYCDNLSVSDRINLYNNQINSMQNYEKYIVKNNRIKIYEFINNLSRHNRKNAKIEYEDKSIYFHDVEHKRKIIAIIDTTLIDFSKILTKLYLIHGHRIHPVNEIHNGEISTIDMFDQVVFDIYENIEIIRKSDDFKKYEFPNLKPLYGANLCLVSLIEENLTSSIKTKLMKKYLKKLEENEIDLTDVDLINFLRGFYYNETYLGPSFHGPDASTVQANALFVKYKCYEDNSILSSLFQGKVSMGDIIRESELNIHVEKQIIKMMGILFGVDNLNLRNNLAHCRYTDFNYHSWPVTIVLYDLLIMLKVGFAFREID